MRVFREPIPVLVERVDELWNPLVYIEYMVIHLRKTDYERDYMPKL